MDLLDWSVPRDGGMGTRLPAGIGVESDATFSPDGQTVAFLGDYDGNIDIFTMPVAGGVSERITYHPAIDRTVGWTPDGQRVLLRSNRQSFFRYTHLFYGGP